MAAWDEAGGGQGGKGRDGGRGNDSGGYGGMLGDGRAGGAGGGGAGLIGRDRQRRGDWLGRGSGEVRGGQAGPIGKGA